jgi:hypothetical protein
MSDEHEKQVSPQEYWKGFPEAPYSDTFKWIDGAGFEHMTTVRQWSGTGLYSSVGKMVALILETGGKPANVRPPAAAAPQPDPAAKIAQEEGHREMAAELQAQAQAVPLSRKGLPYKTFDAAIVEVLPQPDKVTISFYGDGRKYPDCKVNKWKVEQANGLMKHVTAETMDKPAKYTLACRVYYTDGAQYTKPDGTTGNYKDIEHVRPV